MKQHILFVLIFLAAESFSQAPQAVNYQAVVRDAGGAPYPNHAISLKISIHEGSPTGTVVYTETDAPTTNQFGLITVAIGVNNQSAFSAINWAGGTYYNEVDLDITGGTNYQSMGTTQLISVPYALFANQANEHQTLSINGNTLSISSGNSVALPSASGSAPAFSQTLVIGNKASTTQNATQTFIGATQETGVSGFVLTATESMAFVIGDSIAGSYQTNLTTETILFLGCGGGNGSVFYGATTHKGNTFYSYSDGCGDHLSVNPAGTVVFVNGSYPTSGNGILFSDGNYLYMHQGGSNWNKYSVSGDSLTTVGLLTLSNTSATTAAVLFDGTYFFSLSGTTLSKYSSSGNYISQKAVYGGSGLVNIDATRLYLLSGTTAPGSPSSIGEAVMVPVGKP